MASLRGIFGVKRTRRWLYRKLVSFSFGPFFVAPMGIVTYTVCLQSVSKKLLIIDEKQKLNRAIKAIKPKVANRISMLRGASNNNTVFIDFYN